jgi:hypothetical protein
VSPGLSVVLVEGPPGSGKTTAAQQIAAEYRRRGTPCAWEREEARDHPVLGADVRRRHQHPDYDEICLAQWQRFVDSAPPARWVLDGCAMQSTVRFMFEQNWPMDRIASYWRRFEQIISGVRPAFVYFTDPRPYEFMREHTIPTRAAVWPKIARHVRKTPTGRRLAAEGFDAPVEFWIRYRSICDSLLGETTLPVLTIDTREAWQTGVSLVTRWLDSLEFDRDE